MDDSNVQETISVTDQQSFFLTKTNQQSDGNLGDQSSSSECSMQAVMYIYGYATSYNKWKKIYISKFTIFAEFDHARLLKYIFER
jgi:hypothetical protein